MARVKHGRFRGLPRGDVLVAKAMANVQYGPKMSALDRAVVQASHDYVQEKRAAKVGARSAIVGATRARKPTAKVFNTAARSTRLAAGDVATAFRELGAAADPFRAATAREQGAALSRIAESKAQALNELKQRKQEARAGRQLGLATARGEYKSALADLRGQKQSVRGERSTFLVGQLSSAQQERREAAEKRRAERKAFRRQQHLEAIKQRGRVQIENVKQSGRTALEKQKAASKAAATKAKQAPNATGANPATRAEAKKFESNFEKALRSARTLKGAKWSRAQAASALISGYDAKGFQKIYPIDDQIAISAALDQAFNGAVSPAVARKIRRRRGLRPRSLASATTPAELRRGSRYTLPASYRSDASFGYR